MGGHSEDLWAEQMDELEAAQSIYGANQFTILHSEGIPELEKMLCSESSGQPVDFDLLRQHGPSKDCDWTIVCRNIIEVRVPDRGLLVSLSYDSESEEPAAAGIVNHLPAVQVCITLKSDAVPLLTASSCWMKESLQTSLENELKNLCQYENSSAIFTCSEYVKSFIDDNCNDSAFIFNDSDMLRVLLQFNASRKERDFIDGTHTCTICYEEMPGSLFTRLENCEHFFCTSCLETSLTIHITEGNLDSVLCPSIDCRRGLEPHEIRSIVSGDLYDRWEALTLKRALDKMPDAAYCPRCKTLSIEDAEDNSADCPRCLFVFCTLCEESRHPGVECVGPETKLKILQQKAAGGGQDAVQQLRIKEQEYKSLIEVQKISKSCPACGMAIQRTEGCNKMTCSSCGSYFCWLCNADISVDGYDHFKDGKNCVLFDQQEILRWERRWEMQVGFQQAAMIRHDIMGEYDIGEHRQEPDRIQAQRPPRRDLNMTNCPNCGQVNYRIGGNNHIHCWSCTRYYCAVCRLVLHKRGGNHFAKNGCPQHS